MEILQHQCRELETLRISKMYQYKALMCCVRVARHSPLDKGAPELHILWVFLKGVDQRKRVFAFVKIFAEPLLRCILYMIDL